MTDAWPDPDGGGPGGPPHDGAGDGGDGRGGRGGRAGGGGRPRVYKLRLAMILVGLGTLAIVSTVFGMMMAVAADLPALENRQQYRNARNSVLLDHQGRHLGLLTRDRRILVQPGEVSAAMRHAIVAVEDRRFYENNGIDFRGIVRALIADIARRRTVQGASTITQQFVKNAMAAQNERTVFQKLREAALAYHLNRKWDKAKILTEYLNVVYFGNGAYGIESAARAYFGNAHVGCGRPGNLPCAAMLTPPEAALLAGMVASPSAYDPGVNRRASRQRRDLVLHRMHDQGRLSAAQLQKALAQDVPRDQDITVPQEESWAPWFTTWVNQEVVERFGAQRALTGGLRIRTTLDLDLQNAATEAVRRHLPTAEGPAAALVAIENGTGEVRAMVGNRPGVSYTDAPFNLATQGQRQPGSAFKVFVLAQALREGIDPYSTWESRRKVFDVPNSSEKFVVENYEGQYSGVTTLASATAQSDNSVFAEVGIKVGTGEIARLARQMGIRTPVSSNYAITLGGLKQGVTPLDMAHAYETLAAGGLRVDGRLVSEDGRQPDEADDDNVGGATGIHQVVEPGRRGRTFTNRPLRRRIVSKRLAEVETEILKNVLLSGTGTSAATGGFAAGKTGTTENYGDAWFVGYNKRWTVAVWVGYPEGLKPMEHDFNGGPVAGGTFPAGIWRDFILAANAIQDQREAARAAAEGREYVSPDQEGAEPSITGGGGTTTEGEGADESGTETTAPDGQQDGPAPPQDDGPPSPAGGGRQGGGPSPSPPSGGGEGGGTGAPGGGTAPPG